VAAHNLFSAGCFAVMAVVSWIEYKRALHKENKS